MEKIKLPWRRFGDERPEINQYVLVAERNVRYIGEAFYFTTSYLKNNKWVGEETDSKTSPDDRWIYLSEIANPFEEEK